MKSSPKMQLVAVKSFGGPEQLIVKSFDELP